LKRRYPSLEARANRYLAAFYYVSATVVYALAALALLQAWGFHAFAWLETEAGRKTTGNVVTIALVLLAALFLWELVSAAIERYLTASDHDGRPLARSNRARTLLPLMRSTLLIFFIVIFGLVILSQIGLNIAPLLAGAGVIGIAIGVGAQALVKDVLTGIFILVEDTLAVGEFVDVGKAQGTVESLSIRTIRVRDLAGTLHTVPFSEVGTIRNMTRDYAYALHDIGVVMSADIDKVMELVRAVGEELCQDPEWKWCILQPIEVFGLERFSDTAQIVRVRLKTAPLQQWTVQREYNRRIKNAFDRHGIEMPAANQTRYLQPPPSS
jgi:small conductance mechanosensitive channel